ncbi:FAD-binding protein [Granulicella sp. 5B5]|uniref:FAD-binding protein n=1 Tax=Granulicella sp. 5B5 TaxID=1617967 RepID=UPI0015F62C7F|nr:FAD-binding protein [Granulicella sp. 5B5]QMV18664.1 FAD-binding protein [Granulicella sp. 5B5]
MNKREFLKTTGAFLASSLVGDLAFAQGSAEPRTNWAGNYTFHAKELLEPKTVEEVQHAVMSHAKLRALGSRHSFNGIADSYDAQISVKALDTMTVDKAAKTVTVGAGVTYGKLAPWLDAQGYALHNLASLPHISVMGACATATHGSGPRNGNLSTAMVGLEMVTADGKVVTLSHERDGDRFLGAVVNLGALGVATKVTLRVEPTFQMRQVVYENLSMDQLEHNLDAIFASGYSTSLFTDWQHHRIGQVWIKSRVHPDDPATLPKEFYGATVQTKKLHPVPGHDAEPCTEQMGIPGPWYERMPHFRMNFTPSSGREIQTEYFVGREHGYAAIRAVEELRDHISPHLFITELRTIAADDLWLSMAHGRESMAIHFTWKPEPDAVHAVLPLIEAKLAPFHPRPHWAKVYTMPPATLDAEYPKLGAFKAMVKEYDPQGKFRNAYMDHEVFGA